MTSHRSPRDALPQIPAGREMKELVKARMSLGHLINDTNLLKDHDYELIGRFIQTYCIADLEARRMINSFAHIRLGNPTTFALKLNDKDTLDHLMACADSCVWNLELAEGIRKAAEIFIQHRQLRHMFAHWAGRRVPGHDVYIFFTASLGKHKLPNGAIKFEEADDANMQYGVMPISNLLEETKKLEGHAQYLANMGAQLEAKAAQIGKALAKDVADGRLKLRPYTVGGSRA
ncbi:hypothetical protein F0H33_01615 [Xanthomonas translucens pv. undulosa]|uniref:hypothetical protein n=2 Tax=Xanthomonas campestris pv. translucens TaxID=343 RepID=UPI000AF10D9F|nr:hypothetical protein [Xanthomonas translucens]QEN92250.1 hypothetical protein F0H33_01615 [Xanthomonas translucens pv. undulosa]QSQ61685.1 hypothetical protein ISN38_08585 [Xanthomonas translucens pv. undulosa]WLA08902.1 hypothetical protein MO328_01550 [Xanthomonas translucens]